MEDGQFKFPMNATFMYCISTRIPQLYPDYHRGYDFTLVPTDQPSHLLRFAVFVQKLKTLKISSSYWKRPAADPTEEYTSYRDPTFDISIFESLKAIHIRDFNLTLFRNMHTVQSQILEVECVSNGLEELRELLINFVNQNKDSKNIITKSWANLRKLSVSRNKLREFDESLAMAPNLGEVDISYNAFHNLEGLQFLQYLNTLDASFNRISSLDKMNLALGNIRTLILANNEIEFLQGLSFSFSFFHLFFFVFFLHIFSFSHPKTGAEKLYSLQHLDLSFNRVMELNETNRLGELPFLEELTLKGNACCEQRTYRSHVFAYLGERATLVTLDGETMGARDKEEAAGIQEKIKQEKAKVSTKSLISKKKTKTRVVDILPPKKKKDRKDLLAEITNPDTDLTMNGASVADSLNIDVERILSKYGTGEGSDSASTEGLPEESPTSDVDPSFTASSRFSQSSASLSPNLSPLASEESLNRRSNAMEAPNEAHLIRAELALEEEREREKVREEERVKEREKERERERERKRLEKEKEAERLQELERQKAKEVSPEMARIIERLKKKEDLSSE